MKKALTLLLAGLMVLFAISAVSAQDAMPEAETVTETEELPENWIEYDYDELNVAGITPMSGNFFSSIWSNVTSDIDVRMLLHGYNLVDWNGEEGLFMLNETLLKPLIFSNLRLMKNFPGRSEIFWKFFWAVC